MATFLPIASVYAALLTRNLPVEFRRSATLTDAGHATAPTWTAGHERSESIVATGMTDAPGVPAGPPSVVSISPSALKDVGAADSHTALLRRNPTRQQGRLKVERILDAANDLLEEVGYERAVSTPALIIGRSQVAGGSFYTYFASPEHVMEVLAVRIMERSLERVEQLTAEVHPTWEAAAEQFSKRIVTYYEDPAARVLWVEGHLSLSGQEADLRSNARGAARLGLMLQSAEIPGPQLDPICYQVAIEILDHLMRLAYRLEGADRAALLSEARHAFFSYLCNASQRLTD